MVKLIKQFSSASCYFLFFRSKYHPKRPAVEYFYVSLPQRGRTNFTSMDDNSKIQ